MLTEKITESSNLVSIICRTIGRGELAQALESIASQSYSPIEIILVNAARKDLADFNIDKKEITIINPENHLSRPEAANAGLEAANGSYLMFLDDDDWITNDHIENLISALEADPKIKAAYSSAQKTNHEGIALDYFFDKDYNPYTLMRDNYIPIHTMLFEKSLSDGGCRFDKKFDIYEDWDFWLQLSQHTNFKHIKNVTAFYRSGGDSDTAPIDDAIRFEIDSKLGKARAAIFEKWKNKWNGNQINLLLGDTMKMNVAKQFHDLSKNFAVIEARFNEELNKNRELENKINQITKDLKVEIVANREKESIILDKDSMILEKDSTILEKDSTILDKESVILDRESVILDRESTILDKESVIRDRESMIHQLSNRIAEVENKLGHKIEVEKHLRMHERQLENAFNEIINSKTWRVTSPLRKIMNSIKGLIGISSSSNKIEPVALVESNSDTDEREEQTEFFENDEHNINPNKVEHSKLRYMENAKANLSKALTSNYRLVFPKSKEPQLSIILVFFNQAQLGLLCLESLLTHADVNYELIIVDNGSSDNTGDLLDRIENITLIKNDENLGFVKAVNQGVETARGRFILLLNNDAVIEEFTLSSGLESITSDPTVGAVGGKIKLTDGTLQEAGSIIWNDGSCMGYGRGEKPTAPPFMFKRDVDYCSGAFLLFRKLHFNDLGGFDLNFSPAYYEETDFCVRLQKRGLRIVYNPNAQITHYEFGSSDSFDNASLLQKKHRRIFCEKHGDWLSEKYKSDVNNIVCARNANNFSNVLLIDDRVPHPSLGSGYPRCAHLLNSLAKLNLNITLYPLQFPIDDWDSSYQTLDETIEIISDEGRAGLRNLLTERKGYFQHIIVSRTHNMEFFKRIVAEDTNLIENVNIIYDAEALTANREIMRKELQNNPFTKREKNQLIKEEITHASIANSVITVSKKEANIFQQYGVKNTHILGHTIKVNPGKKSFDEREGLLFVGALRDEGSPNVDSLLWFMINVLPLIEREIPNIKLYVVGDYSASSLFTIDKANIVFKGRLEKVDEMYNQCRVFIAPTRFAAGIPHKVHEAAAMGIPAVTTNLLAQQLQWDHGKELLSGITAEEFSQQCIRLYQDPEVWSRIREGGLKAVKNDCSDSKFDSTIKLLFS